jgi:serine phosphatase RsbU (regulator of sigma subunit)
MRKKFDIQLLISMAIVLQFGFLGFFYLSQKYTKNQLIGQVIADNQVIAKQMIVLFNKTGLTTENPETDSILQYICDSIKLPNQGFICLINTKGNIIAAPGLAPGKSMLFNPELQDIDFTKHVIYPKDLSSDHIFSGFAYFPNENRQDIVVSLPFGKDLRIFVNQNIVLIKQQAWDSSKPLLLFGLIITFFVIIGSYSFLKKIVQEYINKVEKQNKELNELQLKLQKLKQEENFKETEEFFQSNKKLTEIHEKLSLYEKNISANDLYTKIIQQSILSKSILNQRIFKENFILSIPRDVIGGDFHWFYQTGDLLFVAVADSTGHGAVGALMSIYASNLLNETIIEKKIKDPAIVLEYMRRCVVDTFAAEYQTNGIMPGLNIALCVIDEKNYEMIFAGAKMPLFCLRENKMIEIEPDSMSVGIISKIEDEFKNQNFTLQSNDIIYLFSDGFYDQFGGKEGRKFLLKNFKSLLLEIKIIPLQEQRNILEHTIVEWKGNYDQVDDILVIGLKIK